MKLLKKLLLAIVVLVLLLVGSAFLLPAKYGVERSVEIAASPEKVFDHVNHLQKNEAWSPWAAADPSIKTTYSSSVAKGVGAWYSWTSENSGDGKLTIEVSEPPKRIVNELDFMENGKGKGYWTFEATKAGTIATWRMEGDAGNDPVGRWFGFFIDGFVGPMFEDGLARLKKVSES
ncbi:MAG: SRPBCC family protein [Deltaproteobacteria bacterium]|jgi:uncharacterized protein YndB with AHSA1/START domain